MSDYDPVAFGREISRLRENKGWSQKEVAERIPTYYADANTYGRIERGKRRPDLDAAIAIVVEGLMIKEEAEVNRLLQLAGYDPLGKDQLASLGILAHESESSSTEQVRDLGTRVKPKKPGRAIVIVSGAIVLATLIAQVLPAHVPFVLGTSLIYAALYVVSLYLETAFDPHPAPMVEVAAV